MRLILFVFSCLLVAVMGPAARSAAIADGPASDPLLRIEAGMHTASINRFAVDAENRTLVTSSYDKTIRLWTLPEGELARIIRVPIGEGKEGALYAVAVSPDGKLVAAGGWTGGWQEDWSLYFFDTATGRMVRRLGGLPLRPLHLDFSKDGAYLAVTYKMGAGLQVYRVEDFALAAEDRDYGDDTLSVEFTPDGRLVTASLDGSVRLYDAAFKLVAKTPAVPGKVPVMASFSPDTTQIAVGYDSPLVEVLSAKDLAFLFSPDLDGLDNSMNRVAWSADGRFLFSAGKYERGGKKLLVRWEAGGKGARREKPISNDMVMHLLTRKAGGVFYASDDPAFGALDAAFEPVLAEMTSIAKFQDLENRFRVSADGDTVYFAFDRGGVSPARFSISRRAFERNPPAADEAFLPPVIRAEGVAVENWRDSRTPILNGAPLVLKRHERAFSLAILPDGQSFLLGTRWRLRYFDKQGREIWNVQPPEQVWAANVARQGKLGILALGDGTIRWYRLSDGEELLAFFPHRDGKRWVAWTPSGYYMASAGGDTLIGWHVNRGKDRAGDFFSVSRFRDDLYRPDVVGKVLAFLDEGKALAAANQTADRRVPQRGIADILPPVVAVEGGSAVADGRLTLNYSIRSASGEPAKGLRVLADGRPIAELTGDIEAKQDGTQHRLDVALPENTRGISLVAKNRHGIYSEPAMLALDYAEGGGAKPQPKLYLLAIGVSDYANPELKLKYAGRDARDFSDKASLQKGGLYRSVETRVLTDGEASLENVLEGLAWIQKTPQSGDVAMIFLAGHGVDDSGGNYFFLPHGTDLDRLPETAVPYERIRSTLASIPARTFLFVDTCHAAGVWGQAKSAPVDINRVVNDLASPEYGVVVFASSANEQLSLESDVWQNGAFTEALLEGIDGEATYRDKPYITVSMLDVYLSERVYELTRGRQTPTTRRPLNVPSGFRIVLPASLLESLGR